MGIQAISTEALNRLVVLRVVDDKAVIVQLATRGMMMSQKRRIVTMFLWALVLIPVYRGFSQSPTGTPTPSPSHLMVEAAAGMDDAPTDCGVLAEPVTIDPQIPKAIGTWPLWLAVPNMGDDSKGVVFMPQTHYQTNTQLEGWWSTKVGWFIRKSYVGTVQIQGVNVTDGSPIYFHFNTPEPVTTAALNPAEAGGFVEGLNDWAFFPSNLWVSKAGCYQLHVRWDGGQWQQIVAVGYLDIPPAP